MVNSHWRGTSVFRISMFSGKVTVGNPKGCNGFCGTECVART